MPWVGGALRATQIKKDPELVREEGTLEILIRREKEAGWDGIQEVKIGYKD